MTDLQARAKEVIEAVIELPDDRFNQSVGTFAYKVGCCFGAHLANFLGIERWRGDDYRWGAHVWAKHIGEHGNIAHAIVMLRNAGAGDRPLSSMPWESPVKEVCKQLLEIEELPSLVGKSFDRESFIDMRVSDTDFEGASFEHANLVRANFENCNLTNANFEWCAGYEASFKRTNLTDANFKHASLDRSYFNNARIIGTNFESAILHDANLTDATIVNPIFKDTKL